jgi:hypothetical protein
LNIQDKKPTLKGSRVIRGGKKMEALGICLERIVDSVETRRAVIAHERAGAKKQLAELGPGILLSPRRTLILLQKLFLELPQRERRLTAYEDEVGDIFGLA